MSLRHLDLPPDTTVLTPWRALLRYRRSPALAFASHHSAPEDRGVVGETERFLQAYWVLYATFARFFLNLDTLLDGGLPAIAGTAGVAPTARAGLKLRNAQRFFGSDFAALVIHARILCDRALPLLRIANPDLGHSVSITSFKDHRNKLLRGAALPTHLAPWHDYVRNRTEWFASFKEVRDHFIVHQGRPHAVFLVAHKKRDLTFRFVVDTGGDLTQLHPGREYFEVSGRGLFNKIVEFLAEVAAAAKATPK